MAIARLSMKVGKAGKAAPHAAYIAREGKFAERLERGERLAATEAGNMPAWAQAQPGHFWQAADAHERANGTTYREMEIALPRELTTEQQTELVREWVKQEIGDRHAYQWAIHVPTAADGKEQPHVHLMFSERQVDGIERDPEQYFKRYNGKAPEKGGAKKGYGPNAGKTLTAAERAADLKDLRGRWETACNRALERAGQAERIDMRSLADQGREEAPERKMLPSEWRKGGKAKVIEFRAAKEALRDAVRTVVKAIPSFGAAIIDLVKERQKRQEQSQARQEAIDQVRTAKPERTRLADTVRAEFDGQPLDAVKGAVEAHAGVLHRVRADYQAVHGPVERQEADLRQAKAQIETWGKRRDTAAENVAAWDKAHPVRVLLGRSAPEREQWVKQHDDAGDEMASWGRIAQRHHEAVQEAKENPAYAKTAAAYQAATQRGAALEALQAERIEEFGKLANIPGTPEHAEQQQRRAKALEQVSGQLSREQKQRDRDRGGHGL